MRTHNNIITLPTVSTAGLARQPASGTPAQVIDLSTHRATTKTQATDCSNRKLSPGEVWDALNDGRVQVHYQPQYDMSTGKKIAAEALIRLIDHDGTLIYPDRFIEMVEDSDLIVPLGRAVLEQACADLAASRAEGISLQRIAINLSARQFNVDTGLINFVDELVAHHGLQHSDLEFELTERQSLVPQCDGVAVINALAKRGVRIVIDDFGIDYSSVVYLTELPVSAFKLDRALVMHLAENEAMQHVVHSLLTLAEHLGMEVVAEGIETRAQHDFLAKAGCPNAQGFGFAKPMAFSDLLIFVTENNAVCQKVFPNF